MKKFLFLLAGLLLSLSAKAGNCDLVIRQLDLWGSEVPRLVAVPAGCAGASGVIVYESSTAQPQIYTIDSTLTFTSGQLRVGAVPQASVTGLVAALAGKFNQPGGSTSQYLRGDGSVFPFPTIPSVTPFNFSQPATRTLAVSTSYQASDPTKAAVITPSYACTNATTVLAASACTLQVRMGTGTLTCSTGTVVYTQSLTVGLGLLITQNSTNPVQINLPIGASFIICPTAGTFTISAVEQTAG